MKCANPKCNNEVKAGMKLTPIKNGEEEQAAAKTYCVECFLEKCAKLAKDTPAMLDRALTATFGTVQR